MLSTDLVVLMLDSSVGRWFCTSSSWGKGIEDSLRELPRRTAETRISDQVAKGPRSVLLKQLIHRMLSTG